MGRVEVDKLELLGLEPGELFDFGVFLMKMGGKNLK